MEFNINCNHLSKQDINKKVVLKGWIKKNRQLGAITFIDLFDRHGVTQLVLTDELVNRNLGLNDFIVVTGEVKIRKQPNPQLKTGDIEVHVLTIQYHQPTKVMPFETTDPPIALEKTRLKYRYLDLRRHQLQANLAIRSKVYFLVYAHLQAHDFLHIETPILNRLTPEGARDFIVPSRQFPGKFYALPQSPQLYKQLLMIGGIDRYFQLARCFRDEDFRADRQPEFTQIDIEMVTNNPQQIKDLTEGLMVNLWKEIKNITLKRPFPTISYQEAIDRYGSDAPDLRFALPLRNLNAIISNLKISLLEPALEKGCVAKTLFVPYQCSGKMITSLQEIVHKYKLKLFVGKVLQNEYSGFLRTKMNAKAANAINDFVNPEHENGVLFIVVGKYDRASHALGAVRKHLGPIIYPHIIDFHQFIWVEQWPLFEWDDVAKKNISLHHPFTKPDLSATVNWDQPATMKAQAYDIVWNGQELGGGSLRVDNFELQAKIFEILGLTASDIKTNFGWFIEALQYGVPPHGGIALGFDRIIMALCQANSIRDVIAFPKNNVGRDVMSLAPTQINELELAQLGIKITDELKNKQ